MEKPFSPAAERNKEAIYQILKQYVEAGRLFEVGSGTGQHAIYMSSLFPEVEWFVSDRPYYHSGIKNWMSEYNIPNLKGPLKFVIGEDQFPIKEINYLYTANTLHIMSWKECEIFFYLIGVSRPTYIFIYGPFNYGGKYTSKSNEAFDFSLKSRDPLSGIRDFESIKEKFNNINYNMICDHEMPANNRLLVFKKI